MEEVKPALGIFQCFNELIALEIFLLDSGVVLLNSENSLRTLLKCQELGLQRIIRKEKANEDSKDNCDTTSNNYNCQGVLLRRFCGDNSRMNHFQVAKCSVLIQSTPYESRPDVIGLELPAAHIIGIMIDCSRYVKNIDIVSRKAGTIQASQHPRKNLTTKREAKLLHGMCSNVTPPLCRIVN